MPARKVPLRQCIGCQEQKPKRSMLRVVLTPDGRIAIDPSGRQNGRGAYVCPRRECLELARKRKALDRGLKTKVDPEVYDELGKAVAAHEGIR